MTPAENAQDAANTFLFARSTNSVNHTAAPPMQVDSPAIDTNENANI